MVTVTFEEIVEISLKSVGAPIPEIKDNGAPNAKEWAADAFENPVPIKISHIGIENILEKSKMTILHDHFKITVCQVRKPKGRSAGSIWTKTQVTK